MSDPSPIIGILGGVGPMAGVFLHRHIIAQTKSQGRDQGHIPIHHVCRPADVPDRTGFLLGTTQDDPAVGMMRSVEALVRSSGDHSRMVAGIPCNTFHVPSIFSRFEKLVHESANGLVVLNMLEETMAVLATDSAISRVGVLSTTGTRTSGVYRQLLQSAGLEICEVSDERQSAVHDAIYNPQWGLKATEPPSERACDAVKKSAQELAEAGADAIVLGCTELPLAMPQTHFEDVPLVDPMQALARALIRETYPERLV